MTGLNAKLPSYHLHSRWSDGGCSISELVRAAEAAGFPEIGISDHLVITRQAQGCDLDFAMPMSALAGYIDEVLRVRQTAAIPVRLAAEIDFFPDTPSVFDELLAGVSFDYLIGSVHFVDGFPLDLSPDLWKPLSQDQIDRIYRRYWALVAESAASGIFDIIGHLDLPKKFGYRPVGDVSREVALALDAVSKADVAVELNTAGWDKPCGSPYPDRDILMDCRRRQIPIIISDDSHCTQDLGRHFARAAALLRDVGYTNTFRLEGRARIPVELP